MAQAKYYGTVKDGSFQGGSFGFILPENNEGPTKGKDVFVHITSCRGGTPKAGQRVSYEWGAGNNGQNQALNVQVLDTEEEKAEEADYPTGHAEDIC